MSSLYSEARILQITDRAWEDLQTYVQFAAANEIQGFGMAKAVADDCLRLSRILPIPRQTCSRASTETTGESLAFWLDEITRDSIDPAEVTCWWHLHPSRGHLAQKSGLYFSQQDQSTIRSWQDLKPWVVSLVVDTQGQGIARLDIFSPIWITVDLSIKIDTPDVRIRQIKALIGERVKKGVVHGFPETRSPIRSRESERGLF